MINNRILHGFAVLTGCGAADMIPDHGAVVLRSNPVSPALLIKYLLICGVDVCPPHVQTVSTSLMSRLVKNKIRL